MKKRTVSFIIAMVMVIGLFAACGSPKTDTAASTSTAGASPASSTAPEQGSAPAGEVSTIEFWYHDGNPTSNAIFEELIKRFEGQNPGYKVDYVGLPADSYLQKYNTAVATNTVPDVVSIRDMDVSTFVNQEALMSFDDTLKDFDQAKYLSPAVLDSVRSCAIDGKLYCLPQYVTMDISWYNTAKAREANIESPKSIDEFLALCGQYADAASNSYFYSLRGGGGSMENMFDFIFTYANEYSLFDDEGNCVLNNGKFEAALDAYASIYWNGWTSKDSVTNGFKEMVAEFGSGTSMFMNHNSSSLAEHQKNLGDGNFMNVLSPANNEGITVTKDLSFIGYTVFNGSKNKEGGIEFAKFLVSQEASSYHCQTEGRIPINDLIYEEDWYKNNPYMQVYQEILQNPNVRFLTHAIWLPQWNEFRSKLQEPGFQAVLLKEKTSAVVLAEWAEYLTAAQKEYLASNK